METKQIQVYEREPGIVVLKNEKLEVWISTLGAAILRLYAYDRDGRKTDTVLGYETLEDYTKYQGYLGAVVGRCANRIRRGAFCLNGTSYQLPINNGPNCNHGGPGGLSFREFSWMPSSQGALFYTASPDGEEGFPAALMLMADYILEDDRLTIKLVAAADEDTMCNFTSHVYFNLSGHPVSIKDHTLQMKAPRFGKVDADGLTTGEILFVKDTPFDFTQEKAISLALESDHEQIQTARGIDHSFFLNDDHDQAILYCPSTGLELRVSTTLPVFQVYSANYVGGEPGKEGEVLQPQSGICFEAQYMPDEINLNPLKAGTILRKGKSWNEEISFQIKVRENAGK